MKDSKYRIKEVDGQFTAQVKILFFWRDMHFAPSTLEFATSVIDKEIRMYRQAKAIGATYHYLKERK